MLRIEDTDQERYVEGAVEIIYRTLQKTGLIHDEGPDKDGGCGPYVQSERQKAGIYMEYAKKLIEKGEAYYCFCDKERLDSLRQEVAGSAVLIIAQRVSTIAHADQIIVLEDGRAVGIGRHEELLETCPVYREIAQSQGKGGES